VGAGREIIFGAEFMGHVVSAAPEGKVHPQRGGVTFFIGRRRVRHLI